MVMRSIKSKVIMVTCSLVVLVGALLTGAIGWQSACMLQTESERQLEQSLKQASDVTASFFAVRLANMNLWSSNPLFSSLLANPLLGSVFIPSIDEYIAGLRKEEPWLRSIALIQDGEVPYDSDSFFDTHNLTAENISRLIQAGSSKGSTIFTAKATVAKSSESTHAYLLLVVPIPAGDENETTENHFVAILDYQSVDASLFDQSQIGRNGFVSLVLFDPESGKVVAPTAKRTSLRESEWKDFQERIDILTSTSRLPKQHNEIHIREQRIPDHNAAIVAVASEADIRAPVVRLVQVAGVISAATMILGLIVAIVFAGRLSGPIHELTDTVKRLTSGDLSVRARHTTHDEVGLLADAFNGMVNEIEANTRNLKTLITQGRKISSLVALGAIEQQIEQSAHAFADAELDVTIVFSSQCFLGLELEDGFFEVDAQGTPKVETRTQAIHAHGDSTKVVQVLDPRDNTSLALIILTHKDPRSVERIAPSILALSNSVASAITTVRLEQTFNQLDQRTHDIRTILANITQGICMVGEDLRVLPEYSHSLETILGRGQLEGQDIVTLLAHSSDLDSQTISCLRSSLEASVGSNVLNFEVSDWALVRDVRRQVGTKSTFLEIDWTPILDANEDILRMMITIRDVTVVRELRAAAEADAQARQVLHEIVSMSPVAKYYDFMRSCWRYFNECVEILRSENPMESKQLDSLKRNLHTIKGNARTMGAVSLSRIVHEVEENIIGVIKDSTGDVLERTQTILYELDRIEVKLKEYEFISETKLGRSKLQDEARIHTMRNTIDVLQDLYAEARPTGELQHIAAELFQQLIEQEYHTLTSLAATQVKAMTEMAVEIGKPAPTIHLSSDKEWALANTLIDHLAGALSHIHRNSLDHGFLQTQIGHIQWHCEIDDDEETAEICILDNGLGVDLEALRKKHLEKLGTEAAAKATNISDEELGSLIFESGFSTREKITELSGRGVGLSAVATIMRRIQGQALFEFTGPRRDNGTHRPFQLRLRFPKSHIVYSYPMDHSEGPITTGENTTPCSDSHDRLHLVKKIG